MKKIYFTLIILGVAVTLKAQNPAFEGRGYMGANPQRTMPQMTAEQQESIKSINLEFRKELNEINNLLGEKRAQLRILVHKDNADMRAVNKKIDEISALQARKLKATTEKLVKTRALLTDEQKVMFDSRSHMKNRGSNYKKPFAMHQTHRNVIIRQGSEELNQVRVFRGNPQMQKAGRAVKIRKIIRDTEQNELND